MVGDYLLWKRHWILDQEKQWQQIKLADKLTASDNEIKQPPLEQLFSGCKVWRGSDRNCMLSMSWVMISDLNN